MVANDEEFLRAYTPENKHIAERNAISTRYRKPIDVQLRTMFASLAIAGVCLTGGIAKGVWNFTRPTYAHIHTYEETRDSLLAIDSTHVVAQERTSAAVKRLVAQIRQTQVQDRARLESRLRTERNLPAYKRERAERQQAFWLPTTYGLLLSLAPFGFALCSGYRAMKLEQEKNRQVAAYKHASRTVN